MPLTAIFFHINQIPVGIGAAKNAIAKWIDYN
jgi:hypothetical protein